MMLTLPATFLLDGKKYKVVRQIGEGAFGFVYHVREALLVLDRGKTSSVSLSPTRDSSVDGREGCKDFALKKMICQTAEQAADAEREIRVMSSLSLAAHTHTHTHILPLWAHAERRNKQGHREFLLLMPLMAGSVQGEIDRFLRSQTHAQEPLLPALRDGRRVLRVLRQTLSALQAMHQQGFRHGDLKPANLLFAPSPAKPASSSSSSGSLPNPLSLLSLKGSKEKEKEKKTTTMTGEMVMLTDFGSVSPLIERVSSRSEALVIQERAASHTTASYRAPELFDTPSECVLHGESDIWSFGCLWHMLCFNRTPFESEREGLSVLALLAGRLSLSPTEEQLWPADWLALLRRCLSVEREKRPSVDELAQALETLSPPPRDLSVRLREIEKESEKKKLQEGGKEKKKEQGLSLASNPLATSNNSNSREDNQNNNTTPLFVADFSVFDDKLNDSVPSPPCNDGNEIVMEISAPDRDAPDQFGDEGVEDEDEFGEFTAA